MIKCTHDAVCLLTATLISIEMIEGRPACTARIFKLHLQNIKIPETYIIRLYLYLSCVVRISLTHFLCVYVVKQTGQGGRERTGPQEGLQVHSVNNSGAGLTQ